jgi:septum formation protein
MKKIILASKSERRRRMLSDLRLDFDILSFDIDENAPDGIAPEELVKYLALRKLDAAVRGTNNAVVIAADTVVSCEGQIFGKPADKADAVRMLRALSGRAHEVYTGVAVSDGVRTAVESERTAVFFRTLSDDEIYRYIETENVTDKAGSYGIQDTASLFVERIEGDYYNVVGLPLCRLGTMLRRDFGIELYRYMK